MTAQAAQAFEPCVGQVGQLMLGEVWIAVFICVSVLGIVIVLEFLVFPLNSHVQHRQNREAWICTKN